MYISLADSCAKGFRRWSDAHEPHGNDNEGDVARVDALTGADFGHCIRGDDTTRKDKSSLAGGGGR